MTLLLSAGADGDFGQHRRPQRAGAIGRVLAEGGSAEAALGDLEPAQWEQWGERVLEAATLEAVLAED